MVALTKLCQLTTVSSTDVLVRVRLTERVARQHRYIHQELLEESYKQLQLPAAMTVQSSPAY